MTDAGAEAPGRIATDIDGQIGTLVIDSPARRNALGFEMYRAIPSAIESLLTGEVRVIVVRGAGDVAFCAGSDISEFATLRTAENWRDYATAEYLATEALRVAPVPTIASIHGFCRGGGLALALCADLRFAADDATFAVPPGQLGIGYPPDGLDVLADVVGTANAKDFVLTARVVDALEAKQLGLVNRVVDKADLDGVVGQTATDIAALAPVTLHAAKFALTDRALPSARQSPSEVEDLWVACYESDDYAEGVRAFNEKRRPDFRGH